MGDAIRSRGIYPRVASCKLADRIMGKAATVQRFQKQKCISGGFLPMTLWGSPSAISKVSSGLNGRFQLTSAGAVRAGWIGVEGMRKEKPC